jgi:hypothetical protein
LEAAAFSTRSQPADCQLSDVSGGWLLARSSRQRRAILVAAMFAVEPPSSSNPTKRLCGGISSGLDSFRRLLLQIGGANIAGADHAL